MRKFRLTRLNKIVTGIKVSRIQALKDFANVKAGDLGGWVQSEHNLSHNGNCWIYDDACAIEYSGVRGNASMHENSFISEHAKLWGNSSIHDNSKLRNRTTLWNNSTLYNNACLLGDISLIYNACVYGNIKLSGTFYLAKDAYVGHLNEILIFKNIELHDLAIYKNFSGIGVTHGEFNGTLGEFINSLKARYWNNKKILKKYKSRIDYSVNNILNGMKNKNVYKD